LIVANLALIISNRSRTRTLFEMARVPNAAMWWVIGGATGFLTLILTVPFLRKLFKFSVLHPVDIAICVGAGLLSIAAFELMKLRTQRKARSG